MAAFVLTKSHIKGKKLIFKSIQYALLFNAFTLAIPQYLIFSYLKMIDTYWVYVLPYLASTMGVFLMKQYMEGSVPDALLEAARIDGATSAAMFTRITLPMISPMIFYLVITGFIGAFKAYSDAVALFGTDLNAAGMNTIVGYIYDMLYGNSGGYPSFASAAAILLFAIVLTITCINLMISKKYVHY